MRNLGFVQGRVRQNKNQVYSLAIHAVGDATVPGNTVPKVLDVECSLEPRCKEAAKGRHKRGKACKDEQVQLVWGVANGSDASAQLQSPLV